MTSYHKKQFFYHRNGSATVSVFTFRLPADNKMKGKRLLSTEDKHALIESLGVEYYLCPDFEEIRAMTPEQFVYGIVHSGPTSCCRPA